jgi:hypothetical protein
MIINDICPDLINPKMQEEKESIITTGQPEQTNNESFLRRMKVQNTVLKKMIAEIELPIITDEEPEPEVKIDGHNNNQGEFEN